MRKLCLAALVALMASPAFATVTGNPPPSAYSCNGVTTTYTISFPYLATSNVVATVTTGTATTTLALGTDYTVTPSTAPSVGTLVLTAGSKCPNGSTLTISRSVLLTQPTTFRTGAYNGPATEQGFDRLTMQIQQGVQATSPLHGNGQGVPLTIQQATSTQNGFLAAADWNAFSTGGIGAQTYTAPFTGAVARLVSNKLADIVSIRDFAACDGVTNDGPAISTWITNQGTTPVTLLVPSVNCLTNTNLIFPVTMRLKLEGNGRFTGTGTIAYNGDLSEAHHLFLTDTPASAPAGMVELLHNSTTGTSYALDIKDFADNPAAPGAGLGGAGAIAIHQYSDRGPGAVQIDNIRSQPAIVLRNTHNEFRALGQGGTGPFLYFVGYAKGTPYNANGGLGTDPVELGRLEGGLPGVPLTWSSKDAATPWAFRSDTTAPSLFLSNSNVGNSLQIIQTGAQSAVSVLQSSASTGVNITSDVNANGFYPLVASGWSHGPKFTTSINSGPVLTLDQEVAGGNQVLFILNKGGGQGIRVNDGTNDVFTVSSEGGVGVRATKTKGSCTLNGGSPATCTAVVISGATCVATAVGTTAAAAIPVAVNVVTTTLTITAANGSTSVVNYHCFG